jgi:hypothetical protein
LTFVIGFPGHAQGKWPPIIAMRKDELHQRVDADNLVAQRFRAVV